MKNNSIKISKIADVENIFGKKLAREIIKVVRTSENMRAKPSYISFYEVKPAYYLNDGDVLDFYAVDIEKQVITGSHFAGSADTSIHHAKEQFSEGQKASNDAVLAVRSYWNGTNMSWSIDVISSNIAGIKQLAS